jgi:hypothetical protein
MKIINRFFFKLWLWVMSWFDPPPSKEMMETLAEERAKLYKETYGK